MVLGFVDTLKLKRRSEKPILESPLLAWFLPFSKAAPGRFLPAAIGLSRPEAAGRNRQKPTRSSHSVVPTNLGAIHPPDALETL